MSGTPLSNNFFLGTHWGEAYGLAHTIERFEQTWLRPTTPIPGLMLTGQDVIVDGVAGGAIAGFATACCIDPLVALQNIGPLATLVAMG